jgi:hypothetical protein
MYFSIWPNVPEGFKRVSAGTNLYCTVRTDLPSRFSTMYSYDSYASKYPINVAKHWPW